MSTAIANITIIAIRSGLSSQFDEVVGVGAVVGVGVVGVEVAGVEVAGVGVAGVGVAEVGVVPGTMNVVFAETIEACCAPTHSMPMPLKRTFTRNVEVKLANRESMTASSVRVAEKSPKAAGILGVPSAKKL